MELSGIRKKIVEKWPDYKDHTLEAGMDDIAHLPDFLRKKLEDFLQTNTYPDIEIEGYTFQQLIDLGLHPLGAFFMLDFLHTDPEKAKKALKRGWDRIIFPENI